MFLLWSRLAGAIETGLTLARAWLQPVSGEPETIEAVASAEAPASAAAIAGSVRPAEVVLSVGTPAWPILREELFKAEEIAGTVQALSPVSDAAIQATVLPAPRPVRIVSPATIIERAGAPSPEGLRAPAVIRGRASTRGTSSCSAVSGDVTATGLSVTELILLDVI